MASSTSTTRFPRTSATARACDAMRSPTAAGHAARAISSTEILPESFSFARDRPARSIGEFHSSRVGGSLPQLWVRDADMLLWNCTLNLLKAADSTGLVPHMADSELIAALARLGFEIELHPPGRAVPADV